MLQSELLTYVKDQVGQSATTADDTRIGDYMELGLHDVSSRWMWPWMLTLLPITLAIADDTEPLPAGFIKGDAILVEDVPIRTTSAREAIATYDETGVPRVAYFLAGNIRFRPAPLVSTAVKFFYYKTPTDFALGTDVPPFAEAFHLCLAEFALWRWWEAAEDYDKANIHQGRYLSIIDLMFAAYREPFGPYRVVLGETIAAPETVQVWGV